MNIAVRADGSAQEGLGHLVRCSALAKEFEACGDHVRFFCSRKMQDGIQWLEQQNFQVAELQSHALMEEANELVYLLKLWAASVVIVDSYELSSEYIRLLSQSGAIVVAIDDQGLYNYFCDVVINGNIGEENRIYTNCSIGKTLLGGKYSILRREFLDTPPSPIRKRVSNILVTMGGSDPNNFSSTVLEGLAPLHDVTVHVVYGPLMNNIDDIKKAAAKCLGRIIIHSSPSSMAGLMAKCDLAISAAGGTVRELFAMGLVSLFVIQADNQLPLRSYMERYNLPLCLGIYSEVTPKQILRETTQLMNNYKLRRDIRLFMLNQVDRCGTLNIVNELKDIMKNIVN